METLKFKTNINCGGCIAKVTPALNETVGEGNWQVDTSVPEKILTVKGETTADSIIKRVESVGFRIGKM
jgi:copper chaperone